MIDQSRTCAREVSEYRKEFMFSAEHVARLDAAEARGLDALNRFWLEAGEEFGFIWTTVASLEVFADYATFTAEVPDVPARDDRAAVAWIEAACMEAWGALPKGDGPEFHRDFMLTAWHAGHESGVMAGAAIGRMEGRVLDHVDASDADLAAEFNSIVRSVDDSTGKRLGAILRLLQDRLDSARGEIQATRFSAEQRFAADMRAIERWQAGEPDPAVRELLEAAVAALDGCHGGADVIKGFARLRAATRALPATWRAPAEQRELMWPDHADLVCWLLAKVEAMEAVPLHPSRAFAEIVEASLERAGPFGVSRAMAGRAADTIDGLLNVIDAQTRKIASLRLQVPRWEAAMDSRSRGWHLRPGVGQPPYRPSGVDLAKGPDSADALSYGLSADALAFALLVLDRFASGEGPFTPADAARVATTIRRGPVANSIKASFVEPDLDADLAGYREEAGKEPNPPCPAGEAGRNIRQAWINNTIAGLGHVPDDLQIAQIVLQYAPGWTYTIVRRDVLHPLVGLTEYEPDRPL